MKSLLLLLVCIAAWSAWLGAVILGKKAWGHKGGTSIFPVIPVFPVLAWLAGLGLDYLWAPAGFYTVGGLHVILILIFLGSSALSLYRIRKNKR